MVMSFPRRGQLCIQLVLLLLAPTLTTITVAEPIEQLQTSDATDIGTQFEPGADEDTSGEDMESLCEFPRIDVRNLTWEIFDPNIRRTSPVLLMHAITDLAQ